MSPLKSCPDDRLPLGGQKPSGKQGGTGTRKKRKKSEMDELVVGLVAVSLAAKRLSKKAIRMRCGDCPVNGGRSAEERRNGTHE